MNIWILHAGWDISLNNSQRRGRYAHLIEELGNRGHSTVQWIPTFNHYTKVNEFSETTIKQYSYYHNVYFIHAKGYSHNVSLQRMFFYAELGRKFRTMSKRMPKPDVIISGIPSVEWCYEAARYAKDNNIPFLLDVRDLWPDILLTAIPNVIRPIGRLILYPFFNKMKYACQNASGICGVSKEYVQWGINQANRLITSRDKIFYLGENTYEISLSDRKSCLSIIHEKGVDTQKTLCCFAGLFEKSYEIETVIKAAHFLQNKNETKIQFVLCGTGSKLEHVKKSASGLKNVVFMDWCDQKLIHVVGSLSSIGLIPCSRDAMQSLPNKPFFYMSHGMILASTLRGEMNEIISDYDIGFTYEFGNYIQLATNISNLVYEQKKLDAMKCRSLELFKKQFKISNIVTEFANYIESFVNRITKD
jgi:glycosyltransferase involved in cell wall biosynthesis